MALVARSPGRPPRRRRWSLVSLFVGAALVPFLAFAATGVLLVVGVLLAPLLILGAILELVTSAQPKAPRKAASEAPRSSGGAARASPPPP